MRPFVFPYKRTNQTSKKIADALGCSRIFHEDDYRYHPEDLIINWGSGHRPLWWREGIRVLNTPRSVSNSVNKATSFNLFASAGVTLPDRTTTLSEAVRWIREGEYVFCRQSLEGQNGEGIVVAKVENELVNAYLYTKYVKNRDEFRVHIFKGIPIFWTKKVIAPDAGPNPNPMIKSGEDWSMGWVDDVPQIVKEEAIKATAALGLDFAAVDIGMNYYRNKAYVFETNTAPGAFGRVTLQKYIEAIQRVLNAS